MMNSLKSDEGALAVAGFASRVSSFGAGAQPKKRLEAERKANLTPKQKARNAKRTAVVTYRTTPESKDLSARLAKHMGLSVGKLIDQAIAELAKREKLELKN